MEEEFFDNTNHMTVPMAHYIAQCDSFEAFEARFLDQFLRHDNRIGRFIDDLLWKYGKNQATVSEMAGLSRSYVGNIVRGRQNEPERDVLIAICLAIGTTIDEVQYLLRYSGHSPLYVRRRRDVVIWFGFMKHMSVISVNLELDRLGLDTLEPKRKDASASST